jgi:hypothetical protein
MFVRLFYVRNYDVPCRDREYLAIIRQRDPDESCALVALLR